MQKIETKQMVEVDVIRKHLRIINESLCQRIAHIDELQGNPLLDGELSFSYSGEKIGIFTAQKMVLDLINSL